MDVFRQLAGQSAEQIATLQATIGTDSSGSLKKHLELQKSPGIMVWERFVPSITIALSSCSRANLEAEQVVSSSTRQGLHWGLGET